MKIRAYLAKGEDRLVPKFDADRHEDYDTSSKEPEHIKKLCSLLFEDLISYLSHFESQAELEDYLKEQELLYQKYFWKGSGNYLLWLPTEHRLVYRSDVLLRRELKFMFNLEEHLEVNSEGEIDQKLMEL